jgi:phosphohistidine phosphatase
MAGEKSLFIVRHGKSGWDYPSLADIDRPLIDRGIIDGYDIANRILKKGFIPEMIVTSPAIRALHTATIFARVIGIAPDKISIIEDLYLAEAHEILSVIADTDDECESLMIFGHNPGFTDLANKLSGLKLENLPTTGLVLLNFKTDSWKGISKKCVLSEFFDSPHNV